MADKELEKKWRELEDIPFDEEDGELVLSEDWWIFIKGTTKDHIWEYFDEKYSKGVHHLIYNLV